VVSHTLCKASRRRFGDITNTAISQVRDGERFGQAIITRCGSLSSCTINSSDERRAVR